MEDVLLGAIIFWLVASIVFLIRRARKGLWKFGLKEWFEGFVILFGFIFSWLFLILGITILPGLVSYLESLNLSMTWLLFALPWVYLIGLLAFFWFLVKDLSRWKLKYTEEEQAIQLEEKIRFKKKLGPFGRFIKIKEVDGGNISRT